ncbi:MAG: DUF192 domain-containing protein [Blastochloris sp.]|nr:DUF192 domain-containing protein [Blastochloris sp.]
MKGLLGRTSLVPLEGLWLKPCNSIHMFFMRFSIDALFLDKQQCIVKVYHSLPPWAISSLIFRAESVLELAAGRANELGLQIGDQLVFTDTSDSLLEKSSHD